MRHFRSGRLVLALLFAAAQIAAAQSKDTQPYLVLVSFDGFRHDYAKLHNARNLLKLGQDGAAAEGLRPGFPSMTFSSHFTIVTGVHAERHGIVDNAFYDPETDEEYQFSKTAQEGKWYRRTPLWVLAERQGIRTATYSWPGSEAAIEGVRPSIWRKYRDQGTHDEQVDQALEWLRLPLPERPRLVILYFSAIDSLGHKMGPDAPEMPATVQELDRIIGRLRDGLRQLPLRVNLVIVSDHGMRAIDGRIALRDFTDLSKIKTVQGGGAILHLYTTDPQIREKVYSDLRGKSPHFEVYRRAETPPHWHYTRDPRIGDLVVVAKGTKLLDARMSEPVNRTPTPFNLGAHGFDSGMFPDMKGVFFAAGPHIRAGKKLPVVDSIHLFPFLAKLLGVKIPADIDGKLSVLTSIYRK
ncbi:MAG TPA: ectonucleotide pyrophosphatase/phosphodiesterase [Bryobacteraceae bacterium]|nr:ectonucleotide pyrophosphatase/phosphodiesterase [Bryobacteraceae bacterium]